MTRQFYLFGIFITALYLLTSLANGIINAVFPTAVMSNSFSNWHVLLSMIALISSIVLLWYYNYKKYWLSFSVAALYTAFIFCQFMAVRDLIATHQQGFFYQAANLAVVVTASVHALSLLISNARRMLWLKVAGIVILTFAVTELVLFILINHYNSGWTKYELTRIGQWTWVAASLSFVCFIMNYIKELSTLKVEKTHIIWQRTVRTLMVLTAITSLIGAFLLGIQFANESANGGDNPNLVTRSAEILAESFDARTFVSVYGDTLRYRLMKPILYDSNKKYPLVVCLHYGGAHGSDNIIQIQGSGAAQMLSEVENRRNYPAFVLVPQCPYTRSWASIDELVFEMIRSLQLSFSIDSKRIYVTGVSSGGYGSWDFICASPKMFAGAIPVCGAGEPSLAKEIIDVPVWAFQGELDKIVPASLSRDMIAAIRKAGGHPRYTEYSGVGHDIWDYVRQNPDLLDWLFAQKRK